MDIENEKVDIQDAKVDIESVISEKEKHRLEMKWRELHK